MNGIQRSDLRIIFVSVATASSGNAVKDFLLRAGFALTELSSLDSISYEAQANNMLVLNIDIDAFDLSTIDQLRSQIPEHLPCLGIFHSNLKRLNYEWLELCCDFMLWPCEQSELFYRLHGLIAKPPVLKNPKKTNEFRKKIIGDSPAFREILERVKVFSGCDAPVMIEGETGTGKEMIARAVHYYSNRKDHPFIPVNCGALPENLVENELFGHAKGAYTDAQSNSKGLVAQAESGTLFLDEIESLSAKGQVSLLRLLQEQEYKPLGSSITYKANIRVVAASNMSLQSMMDKGEFRQDLFYRLNILSLQIPPLRDRKPDTLLLAKHFLSKYRHQYHQPNKLLSDDACQLIDSYHWPGNVRELENLVHRAFLVSGILDIQASHFDMEKNNSEQLEDREFSLDPFIDIDMAFNEAKINAIQAFERKYLRQLMKKFGGNVTLAAQKARKERRALGKLLKKHGIERIHYI